MRKLVYIAGPYRSKLPGEFHIACNILRAAQLALELWGLGAVVITPHLNTCFFGGSQPDSVWLDGDLLIIERCDAIVLTQDFETSAGARSEREHAIVHGKRVFIWPADKEDFLAWLAS